MKNTTTLSILLIAFAVLLLASFFIQGDRDKLTHSPVVARGKLVSDFLPDKVTEIVAKRGDVTVELKKVGSDWLLPKQKNRKALASKIDTLLNGIRDASIVQGRPGSKLSDFDLTPETRTEISLVRESGTTKVLLGKSIQWNASFAQKADGGDILEIDKNPCRDAGVSEKDGKTTLDTGWFYDLKVLGDETKDAIDIVIKKDHSVTRVQKVVPGKGPLTGKVDSIPAEAVWWITEPDGVAADDSKVGSLLSTLLSLNASGYADEVAEKDRGFDKPQGRVLIRLKDGTERELTFGATIPKPVGSSTNDTLVCLSVSGKSDAYKVQEYVMTTALKTSELAKKEEPPPEPATGSTPPPPPPRPMPPHPMPPHLAPPPPVKATPLPVVPAPKVPEVPAPKPAPTTAPATTAATTTTGTK